MSGIGGVASTYSSVSSVALQSQISKLQGKIADCVGCVSTPASEKQNQQTMLSEEIQSLKAELMKVSLDQSQVKLYKPTDSTQPLKNENTAGQLINISV